LRRARQRLAFRNPAARDDDLRALATNTSAVRPVPLVAPVITATVQPSFRFPFNTGLVVTLSRSAEPAKPWSQDMPGCRVRRSGKHRFALCSAFGSADHVK
jgi:hypothetical protein